MASTIYKLVSCVAILTIVLTGFGSSLQIKAKYLQSNGKKVTKLNVTCVPDEVTYLNQRILTIQIRRKDLNKGITAIMKNSDQTSMAPNSKDNMKTEGHIDNIVNKSYLNVIITNPSTEDSGLYTCQMLLLGENYGTTMASVTTLVNIDDQDKISTILQLVKDIDSVITMTKDIETRHAKDMKKLGEDIEYIHNLKDPLRRGECLAGWSLYEPDMTCLKVFGRTKRQRSWYQARDRCQAIYGGDLVQIHDEAKGTFVSRIYRGNHDLLPWIGIRDIDESDGADFRYIDGSKLGGFQPWIRGIKEPSGDICVAMLPVPHEPGMWHTRNCQLIMAASLRGLSPEIREYLRINKLPDVYESLLTGLCVMCPDDYLTFILEKLLYIKENGSNTLQWDIFIEDDMKPKQKIISESNLDLIFNFEEWLMPTPEMYTKAYSHYNYKLKEMCFCAMLQYHLMQKRKEELLQERLDMAVKHHCNRMLRVHIHIWKAWVKYRKGRQAMSFQKIRHVFHVSVGRVIFEAWYKHTLEARKQREYFERLERGENMEDDDLFGQGTGEARDSVSTLPWKIAIQIFSYLDVADVANCACVCRFWKVLTQANLLWSKINFSKVQKRVTDKVATRLLFKARPYLIHLNMRLCHHLSRPTFISVSECRNLQDLNLSECTGIDDETLKVVVKGCKILLYLNISHTNLTDASLRAVAKYCTNLQYISLAFCSKYTDRGLLYMASGNCHQKLQYIDMSGCLQITPHGFQYLANGCPNIQTVILNEFPTLLDECILIMAEKCLKIHTISVLGCPLLTDESIKKMAMNKHLQVIKVDGNHRISDASIKMLGRMCPELHHVYLADCQRLTDATLKSLSGCTNLVVLNIADCVRISDAGVRYLMEGPAAAKIRELNLTNCVRVGDMAMVNVHKRCHNLTYLCVNFCEHISEAGIELLGQIHSLVSLDISGCNCGDQGLSALGNNSSLRDVVLSESNNITDLGLQKFAQQCREVERLDLSHCMNLTDGAIKNLAFCCRMLTVLNLAGCKHVTDLSIQYLSGVCHYLTQLDISGCIQISDKALKYLRKGCKKLRSLKMLYCKKITKQAAQKVQRHIDDVDYNNDEVPGYFGY